MDRYNAPDPVYDQEVGTVDEKRFNDLEVVSEDMARNAPEVSPIVPPYAAAPSPAVTTPSATASSTNLTPTASNPMRRLMRPFSMSSSSRSTTQRSIEPPPVGGPDAAFRTTFACVSLHMTDRIRLSRFPASDIPQIIDIVGKVWQRGITDTREYAQSTEIKLKGRPWRPPTSHTEAKIDAPRLICHLLDGLYRMGWIIKASVDIGHVDSLMFRHQQPAPPPCIWMSISFYQSNRLHLIGALNDFGLILADALGPEVENCHVEGPVFEIKLRGSPWRASGKETVQTRLTLLTILDVLEQQGFTLYAPINQTNRRGRDDSDGGHDTWYCNRQEDWQPGQPIYHR